MADTFDATFNLRSHIGRVVALGQKLLTKAEAALSEGDIESLESANKIFASASSQIVALTKTYQMVLKADRERIREAVLIECLKEVDEQLAMRFIDLYEERLGKTELDEEVETV